MPTVIDPEEQALAERAAFEQAALEIRTESADLEAQSKKDRDEATAATGNRNKRTWTAVGRCVQLGKAYQANPDVLRAAFDGLGMIGPRAGQNPMASTVRFATGFDHPEGKEVTLADGTSRPEHFMPRSRELWVAPASEIFELEQSGVVITDYADFIKNFADPVSGKKSMSGLRAAWERRESGVDGDTVTVSAEEQEETIIKSVAAAPALFSMDASKLAPGVVLGRVSEVLAIVDDNGEIRFHLSPRQDLAALQARLPLSNGALAIMAVKQASELFFVTTTLMPQGDTAMPALASEDRTAPGTKMIQMTCQNMLIDGQWTSSRSRDPNPQVIVMTKASDDSWETPQTGAYFVNAATRRIALRDLAPADKRELFDDVSLGRTLDGVKRMVFKARPNSKARDVSVSLPAMTTFGHGGREMWAWRLDGTVFKPSASITVSAADLASLGKDFVNPNVKKAVGKHAEVVITENGLSVSLGSGKAVKVEAKGSASAKLNVLGGTLIDVLSVVIGLKPENVDFHVDQGGAVEISFSTEANTFRVFIPGAAQEGKVWVANHNSRFSRVTREQFTA